MNKTLIILNPHAAGGRAGVIWKDLEPLLWTRLGELVVAITQKPDEVAAHLDKAQASGLNRVIAIGGDGTNHALINALADLNARNPGGTPMIYGNLPIGTGRDWARGVGIPHDNIHAAADWIASAQPQPVDIGRVDYDGQRRYFLNIASAGISGDVAMRVNRAPVRRAWTFLQATLATMLRYTPQSVNIVLDGKAWYDGAAYLLAVANGTTFGRGMKIAPNAKHTDGLFDVVLVKGMSRPRILLAFEQVYRGVHLTHPKVEVERASDVQITLPQPIHFELDGETFSGRNLSFAIQPGLLHMLA
ncbi:MAG: diacylglycerol kinase family lipid kinase [Chloroflexota bacterium]|nr:diacylglycerol kinase family lipid kinase [Chloroflexota bacterium]